jgi:hypothetical protein
MGNGASKISRPCVSTPESDQRDRLARRPHRSAEVRFHRRGRLLGLARLVEQHGVGVQRHRGAGVAQLLLGVLLRAADGTAYAFDLRTRQAA